METVQSTKHGRNLNYYDGTCSLVICHIVKPAGSIRYQDRLYYSGKLYACCFLGGFGLGFFGFLFLFMGFFCVLFFLVCLHFVFIYIFLE